MSDSKSTEEKPWAETFIESWVPIEAKDPVYVKEAKIAARNEFMQLFDRELAKRVESDKQTLETLAAILSGSGETVTGTQPQDEKRTIEIAQSYIRNKLSARHEEQK